MSERIRELAEQAMVERASGFREFDVALFAELIVGKCVDICKEQANIVSTKYGPARLNMSFMANDCAQAIKEHFKE
jgi:hypothetical protein